MFCPECKSNDISRVAAFRYVCNDCDWEGYPDDTGE